MSGAFKLKIILFILFFFPVITYSGYPYIVLDLKGFNYTLKSYYNNENFIYKNSDGDDYNGYVQIYFYEGEFEKNKYNFDFNKVLSYSKVVIDGLNYYEFTEHFYNCSNKDRLVYTHRFNDKGIFVNSSISKYKIGDYDFKLDKIICK